MIVLLSITRLNFLTASLCAILSTQIALSAPSELLITGETVAGKGVWVSPQLEKTTQKSVRIVVWFDQQILGDGKAYKRRAKEFSGLGRLELRARTIASLKKISAESHQQAKVELDALIKSQEIRDLQKHWIVNGFSCTTTSAGVESLTKVKGVKKIFYKSRPRPQTSSVKSKPTVVKAPSRPEKFITTKLPWYVTALKADKVWAELGITGEGTLNIVHDQSFITTPSLMRNIYQNPKEIPGNGKDDDGNGLVDDAHGYDFNRQSENLTTRPLKGDNTDRKNLHGTSCAHIICGAATDGGMPQFGIAPMGRWAGVIAQADIESAVEWAIEQGADTYSMSFTKSNLGETRSHWRKLMEHGAYCGVYFVSGAGNDGLKVKVPIQMRVPQSIPDAVFAAAGVQRDLSKTPFSSKGPVEWDTEHYKDGTVLKPEVCAFNAKVPLLMPDGKVREDMLNGNSFAGPMFCGTIALMLSADPDLLPWDLREIITSTATDVGPKGVDDETGHGLINCYLAVKEVIRRRDLRKK